MLQRFRFVVAGLVVVLASAVASYYAASAAVPQTLRPVGSTRYALAYGSLPVPDTDIDAGYENLPDLATSITIPAGKKGDVIVEFCAEANAPTLTWYAVRALVGGSVLTPAELVLESSPNLVNDCATFYKLNVPAGTKTVRMQWYAATTTSVWERTMIVTVNIHS